MNFKMIHDEKNLSVREENKKLSTMEFDTTL